MLLRNWCLQKGLANGTRMRLLDVSKKRHIIKCEILTGPNGLKKPVVTYFYESVISSYFFHKTMEFDEGGAGFDVKNLIVSKIESGGQADIHQVQHGWSVVKINGKVVTGKEAKEIISSNESFRISFVVTLSSNFS